MKTLREVVFYNEDGEKFSAVVYESNGIVSTNLAVGEGFILTLDGAITSIKTLESLVFAFNCGYQWGIPAGQIKEKQRVSGILGL